MPKVLPCTQCFSWLVEWWGIKAWVQRHGRCFYCRMDNLDMKYGPSQTADMCAKLNGGEYLRVIGTRKRRFKRLMLGLKAGYYHG